MAARDQAAKRAVELVKRGASNPAVRKRASELAKSKKVQEVVAGVIGTAGGSAVKRKTAQRKRKQEARQQEATDREFAVRTAQQHSCQYSERTVVEGAMRFVVWKDGKALAVYPPLESAPSLEQLKQHPDLQSVPDAWLKTPPDPAADDA